MFECIEAENEKKAKDILKKLKEKDCSSYFCPFINNTCESNCVCIVNPKIVIPMINQIVGYIVWGYSCNHGMLKR